MGSCLNMEHRWEKQSPKMQKDRFLKTSSELLDLAMAEATYVRILKFCATCSVMSNSLRSHGLQPASLLCMWDFSGKNAGVGCHFLHQWLFLTEGLNQCPSVPWFCIGRQSLYHLWGDKFPFLWKLFLIFWLVKFIHFMNDSPRHQVILDVSFLRFPSYKNF